MLSHGSQLERDLVQLESNLDLFQSSFKDCYTDAFGDGSIFERVFEDTRIRLGLSEDLQACLEEDMECDLHYIMSIVGDDEHTTTDSASLGPCLIGFGQVTGRIKVSWKDSGISPIVGNFAEGWMLTPPNAEASFEAVNRRNQRNGVPFTLDPVKIKYLSPVRKQSSEEMDLESKIQHLSEIASWTDRSWFTYDYHQMVLLLANCIFDFEDAITFPFLFRTEGGCGGVPPYGNLDTVWSAMHYYTRGKSRSALLGIMSEAVDVNLDKMKPSETFFLRSSHLAQMGDKQWLKVEAAYRALLKQGNLSNSEASELLKSIGGVTLPQELLDLGTEVTPNSFVVGSAISHLRQDGYIMSELDVKLLLDKCRRENAVQGEIPIGKLMVEIREEERAFKGQHWRLLSELSAPDGPIKDYLKGLLGVMPDEPSKELYEILSGYYRLRSESHAQFSSFYYTDSVRLFKKADIDDYFGRGNRPLREDFSRMESFASPRKKFLEENTSERKRLELIDAWMDSGQLDQILNQPLPPGIGPDDSRIARSIIAGLAGVNPKQFGSVFIALFTGDRKLLRTTAALIRGSNLPFRVSLGGIDRASYTEICLDGVFERNSLLSRGLLDPKGEPTIAIRRENRYVYYYNYLLKSLWPFPMKILSQMNDIAINRAHEKGRNALIYVEYDYPNMERGMDLLRFRKDTNTIEEYGGGFLARKTLESLRRDQCWAQIPIPQIMDWPDFDVSKVSTHYRLRRGFREDRLYIIDPTSRVEYSRVERWRRDLPP